MFRLGVTSGMNRGNSLLIAIPHGEAAARGVKQAWPLR
jgi:hypothetical protein